MPLAFSGELSAASSAAFVIAYIRRFLGFARQALGLKPRGVASHHVRRNCTTTLDPSTCERYFSDGLVQRVRGDLPAHDRILCAVSGCRPGVQERG